MKKYLFLSLFAAFCSCTHYKSTDYEGSIDKGYPNGIYDAIIHVYNPNTKHNATYTLEVEPENEYLMSSSRRIKRRYSNQPVHSLFIFKIAIGIFPPRSAL